MDRFDHPRRTVAVLDTGRMHVDPNEMPERIGDDMALAPHDLFARIEPVWSTRFSGLDRLAVDHASGRMRCPVRFSAAIIIKARFICTNVLSRDQR